MKDHALPLASNGSAGKAPKQKPGFPDFLPYAAAALGGSAGAFCRCLLTGSAAFQGASLLFGIPVGILTVNMLGCFLMGLWQSGFKKSCHALMHPLLATGFLGGFTTFSSLAWDSACMLEAGALLSAFLNMAANAFFCLLFCALGFRAGTYAAALRHGS